MASLHATDTVDIPLIFAFAFVEPYVLDLSGALDLDQLHQALAGLSFGVKPGEELREICAR
jgi:hypothetical protein